MATRSEDEVQAAHDRIIAILNREVPNPFEDDPKARLMLRAAASVLCWILDHPDGQDFAENLLNIDEYLAERGLGLRRLSVH